MSPYNKISVIVGLALITMFLTFLVALPSRTIEVDVLHISFRLDLTAPWFLGGLLALLVAVQSDDIVRGHPAARGAGLGYAFTFWPLPCMLTLFSLPLLHTLESPWNWAGAIVSALLIAAVLTAQHNSLSTRSARWLLTVLAYAACYWLLRTIVVGQFSPGMAALLIALAGTLIAIELLRRGPESVSSTYAYALAIGLIMGEIGWALLLMPPAPLASSLFLFGAFYLLTSLVQQHVAGALSKLAAWEFAVLATAGLAVFWYYTG